MNLLKKLKKSRRNGLLSDNLSLLFVALILAAVIGVAIITIVRIESYDSSLPLRYATTSGLYDKGEWYRPHILNVFAVAISVLNVAIASFLNAQKNFHMARSILFFTIVMIVSSVFIALNVVTSTTI